MVKNPAVADRRSDPALVSQSQTVSESFRRTQLKDQPMKKICSLLALAGAFSTSTIAHAQFASGVTSYSAVTGSSWLQRSNVRVGRSVNADR